MILVDTSVWIAHLRAQPGDYTHKLEAATLSGAVIVGDLILLEVLQGARDDAHASRLEAGLCSFPVVRLLDETISVRAARNYRDLRGRGVTIRKTADLVIGTYCLEHGHALLHDDRDFDAFEQHLGLIVA